MPRSSRDRFAALALAVLVLPACSAEQATPHDLAPFDGVPRAHIVTAAPLHIDPGPDSAALFARVIECYPAPSWFRPEVTAEARVGSRTFDQTGASVGPGGSIVIRVPLWSTIEADREREREAQRRVLVAQSVAAFIAAIVEHRLTDRALVLHRQLEARSRARVAAGVTETAEQVEAMRRVVELEHQRVQWLQKATAARVHLVAMCQAEQAPGLDSYLRRFQPLEPGHDIRKDRP